MGKFNLIDKKDRQVNTRIAGTQLKAFKEKCQKEGTDVSAKIRYFVLRYLEGKSV